MISTLRSDVHESYIISFFVIEKYLCLYKARLGSYNSLSGSAHHCDRCYINWVGA